MKHTLTLLFSILVFTSHGQTIQYLDNNPVWRIYRSVGPCIERGEYNYYLSGDTTINSTQYKKLFSKGYMEGLGGPDPWCTQYFNTFVDTAPRAFLRQENRKLYCLYAGCNNEVLLYNFDLNPNDTVKFYNSCDTTFPIIAIVQSVDSILTGTVYRKVLNLDYSNCGMGGPTTKIIEGIGCDKDFLLFCNSEFVGNALECYGLNGHSIYSPNNDSCVTDIALNIKEEINYYNDVSIYPNPTSDEIEISIPEKSEIEISNIQGQIIKTLETKENKTNVDVSGFSRGVYIVSVETDKGVWRGKFVKE